MRLWQFLIFSLLCTTSVWAALPSYEFDNPAAVQQWYGMHDTSGKRYVAGKGMELIVNGLDPFILGPWRKFTGRPVVATVRIYSEVGGTGEFYWFSKSSGPSYTKQVPFPVLKGGWREIKVKLPALSANSALRLDLPGYSGKCWVQWIRFQVLTTVHPPAWYGPLDKRPEAGSPRIVSGQLSLTHSAKIPGRYVLEYAGQQMAVGWDHPRFCYRSRIGEAVWVDLKKAHTTVIWRDGQILVTSNIKDLEGARWTFIQRFRPSAQPGGIVLSSAVKVDKARRIYFLPLCMIFPANRQRGILPGLEYLDPKDISSSKADFKVEDYKRRVADPEKLTFPMMSMQANGKWISLSWQANRLIQPVYDTPDRLFNSGKHLMGAILSDWNNTVRDQLNPISQLPELLSANKLYTAQFCLLAGRGDSVVPSIQAYVQRNKLPALPKSGFGLQEYIRFCSAGWVDTGTRTDNKWPPLAWYNQKWTPQASAEVAYNIDWLARHTVDTTLRSRLQPLIEPSWKGVSSQLLNNSGLSINACPVAPLVYGDQLENIRSSKDRVATLLAPLRADGTVAYSATSGSTNYGKTHWVDHANGMSGNQIAQALRQAILSGDIELEKKAVQACRLLSVYDNQAPRGAQTWEVPLHAPDIMASGWMCSAYLSAYELTEDPELLRRAIYWAWTGVPFIYLSSPTNGAVGPYATISVFGATNWEGSWTGVPVQWCGLFYADAIRRLERYDPKGPWNQIWNGIVVSGIQQSFRKSFDPQFEGWLPDSYDLKAQAYRVVAINPGLLFSQAVAHYTGKPLWDYHIYSRYDLCVQIPGQWTEGKTQQIAGLWGDGKIQTEAYISFEADLWRPGVVQVTGWHIMPEVWLDGVKLVRDAGFRYDATDKALWIDTPSGEHEIRMVFPSGKQ